MLSPPRPEHLPGYKSQTTAAAREEIYDSLERREEGTMQIKRIGSQTLIYDRLDAMTRLQGLQSALAFTDGHENCDKKVKLNIGQINVKGLPQIPS